MPGSTEMVYPRRTIRHSICFCNEVRIVLTWCFPCFTVLASIAAFVGSIQGRDIEGIQDISRARPKRLDGIHPRDLLIEVFANVLWRTWRRTYLCSCRRISAHRSDYFGPERYKKLNLNYDEVWKDRGGNACRSFVLRLDVDIPERDFAHIPSKKRNMYRRRYEMLRSLDEKLRARWGALIKGSISRGT